MKPEGVPLVDFDISEITDEEYWYLLKQEHEVIKEQIRVELYKPFITGTWAIRTRPLQEADFY